jgi:hypothetical protein
MISENSKGFLGSFIDDTGLSTNDEEGWEDKLVRYCKSAPPHQSPDEYQLHVTLPPFILSSLLGLGP